MPSARSSVNPARSSPIMNDPLVGRVFNDRFRVAALVARGGMGKVYRAVQDPLGRVVALKVLNPVYKGEIEQDFQRRFFLEASIGARLSHPNTVTIFDYGRADDDIYYIAMEFLQGRNLRQVLLQSAQLSPARALSIGLQICRSAREAHALGAVHRDLKPANIFLLQHGDETDFVKVLDFGLVKSVFDVQHGPTQTGVFMGSPGYMSPEQIRGRKVDARSDIYSLGVMLYEMIAGRAPFLGSSSMDTVLAHLNDEVPRLRGFAPHVPEVLEKLVHTCLAKRAHDRFVDMNELIVAMKDAGRRGGWFMGGDTSSSGYADTTSPPGSSPEPVFVATGTSDPSGSGWAVVPSSGVLSCPGMVPPFSPQGIGSKKGRSGAVDNAGVAFGRGQRNPASVWRHAVLVAACAIPLAAGAMWVTQRFGAIESPQRTEHDRSGHGTPKRGAVPSPREVVAKPALAREWNVVAILRSRPTGARVLQDGRMICERTPCDARLLGRSTASRRPIAFVFQLAGYQDWSETREVGKADVLEITAELVRRGRRRSGRGPPVPVRTSKGDSPRRDVAQGRRR